MNLFKTLVLCCAVLISLDLSAQDVSTAANTVKPFGFLLDVGLELGGDEIAEIFFTNGDDQSVNAGQGGSIAVGGEYAIDKFAIRGTVGWKYVTTQASNANIRLTRVPINISANYMIIDKLRIGAGISSQQAIKFKGDDFLPDIDFGSATGPRFEIAYAGVGLTYTMLTYKEKNGTLEYSADAFGLNYTYVFGK